MHDSGWRTAPDGSISRIRAPHGIHGGEIVETLPRERVWDFGTSIPLFPPDAGREFAKLGEALETFAEQMTLFTTGAICGRKPTSAKFYRVKADGVTPSDELTKRREWRRCKRALTQKKERVQPRGERF